MSKAKTVESTEVGENRFLDMTERKYTIEKKQNKIVFCDGSDDYREYVLKGTGESYEFVECHKSFRISKSDNEKDTFILLVLTSGKYILVRKWKELFK